MRDEAGGAADRGRQFPVGQGARRPVVRRGGGRRPGRRRREQGLGAFRSARRAPGHRRRRPAAPATRHQSRRFVRHRSRSQVRHTTSALVLASSRIAKGNKCRFAKSTHGALNTSRTSRAPTTCSFPRKIVTRGVESIPSLGLRQARSCAEPGTRCCTARCQPLGYPGLFQADLQSAKAWASAAAALGSEADYAAMLTARSFLVDAAAPATMSAATSRSWRGQPAMVAPCARHRQRQRHLRLLGSNCAPSRCRRVEEWCGAWCRKHLAGYTGMFNLETIGGRIIEVHLRFADQWPDLYGGDRWVEALSPLSTTALDARRHRSPHRLQRRVVRAARRRYRHPPKEMQAEIAGMAGISSLQITFTRTGRPIATPCHPAAFESPSSTAGIARPAMTRAIVSGRTSRPSIRPGCGN